METSDLLMLNQYKNIVSGQEVFSCKILVESWHFEVYHHINKYKQPQAKNIGEHTH